MNGAPCLRILHLGCRHDINLAIDDKWIGCKELSVRLDFLVREQVLSPRKLAVARRRQSFGHRTGAAVDEPVPLRIEIRVLGIRIDSHIRLGQHGHAVVEVAQLDGDAVSNRTGRGSALGTLAVLAIDEECPISIGLVEVAIERDTVRRGDAHRTGRVERIGVSGPIE